jgi:antitoxin PrlF
MITSKLSGRGRTTIPLVVRRALRFRAGDEIAYRIERERVVLTKAQAGSAHEPFAVFGEWGPKPTAEPMPSFE